MIWGLSVSSAVVNEDYWACEHLGDQAHVHGPHLDAVHSLLCLLRPDAPGRRLFWQQGGGAPVDGCKQNPTDQVFWVTRAWNWTVEKMMSLLHRLWEMADRTWGCRNKHRWYGGVKTPRGQRWSSLMSFILVCYHQLLLFQMCQLLPSLYGNGHTTEAEAIRLKYMNLLPIVCSEQEAEWMNDLVEPSWIKIQPSAWSSTNIK